MHAPAQRQVVLFGPFALDLKAGELHRDGQKLLLQEQPFLVLKMLVEHPGDLVTREAIRRALWPNDTVVEFDQSINATIKKLRLALQDSAEQPQYIETVARRGYRMIAPVHWQETPLEATRDAGVTPSRNSGILLGKKVSHYRVLEILGGGGMGVVYKAEDIKLGRGVALKFLPEELANHPVAMHRFEREARAASALNHPNICTIHGIDEHEGQSFIVMELLEGHTLRDLLSKEAPSPLPLESLLDTATQIARGLQAAHQKGIIHRDIKPANIFITESGQAKILDFGVAKLHETDLDEPQLPLSVTTRHTPELNSLLTLTRTGATVGTAAYMSPEQVRGEKVDARTDLFSFGLVLYEMATGKRAFPGDTTPELHAAILSQAPASAHELNACIPAELETIVNRAIEKDRSARYQTAAAVLVELEKLRRPKPLLRTRVVGLGAAAIIAIAITLYVLGHLPGIPLRTPEIKFRQLTFNSSENPVLGGAISPDGKYLAYSDLRGLHLKIIDTGETHTTVLPEELRDKNVKWSVVGWFPDNTRFVANAYPATEEPRDRSSDTASIWAVSLFGESPTRIRDHALGCAVSPDGTAISFAMSKAKLGERQIWFMGPNGEYPRKIYEAKEGEAAQCWGWSPDGKHYLYVSRAQSGSTAWSQSLEGGPPVSLLTDDEFSRMNDILLLNDGRVVYGLPEPGNGTICNYWIMRLDLSSGKHLQESSRLTNWPNLCVGGGTVSRDDRRLIFMGFSEFFTSYVADFEAGGTRIRNDRHFTLEDGDVGVRGWTADGKVLIAQIRGGSWNLYKQAVDSEKPEPIVFSVPGGVLLLGATTPDGKWYIGRIWPNGENSEHITTPLPIVRIPLTGGSPETILEVGRHANISCSQSPANTCVIAQQSSDGKQMVIALFDPIQGPGAELARFAFDRELKALEVPGCIISPDGTRLAIARSPQSSIEIRSLRGQLIRTVPNESGGEMMWMVWSPDQKGLFVTRKAPSGWELLRLDFQGHTKSLRKCVGTEACLGVPSPDGQHLAFIDRIERSNMWMIEGLGDKRNTH